MNLPAEPDEEKIQAWLAGELNSEESRAVEVWMEENGDSILDADLPPGVAGKLREEQSISVDALIAKVRRTEEEMQAGGPDWRSMVHTSDREGVAGMLGPYEVLEKIAHGGMGIVLKARDPKLDRLVALKLLSPELARDKEARRRFLEEARAVAALEHDNVLPVYFVSDEGAVPFFAMRYAGGGSLQDALRRGENFTVERITRIGRQVALALSAAHEAGIVHRDIKPANILFDESGERVWVCDFGIAHGRGKTSVDGLVSGTPEYMSPEQAEGNEVDERSDLFSLGSLLYRCAGGRDAFAEETTVSTLKTVAKGRPKEPLGTTLPKWFRDLVSRLLEVNPDRRPKDAREVARVLEKHGNPGGGRWSNMVRLACAACLLLGAVLWALLQIPAFAKVCNRAIAGATDRDVIFANRFGAFESLRSAVESARPGDELLLTSRGPFPVSGLSILESLSLTLSADGEAIPEIELAREGFAGIIVRGNLTMNGISLTNPLARPSDAGIVQVYEGGELNVRHCYFSVKYLTNNRWLELPPAVIELAGAAGLRMEHTVVNTGDCRAIVCRGGGEGAGKADGPVWMEISQSCFLCSQIVDFNGGCMPHVRIDFHENLSLARVFLWKFARFDLPERIEVRARANIFNQQRILNWFAGNTGEEIRASLVWKGENNLHRATRDMVTNAADPLRPRPTLQLETLGQWRAFLNEELPGSEEARFNPGWIDQLSPGKARKNVKEYLEQFGADNSRGPDASRLGPGSS